MLVVVTTIAVLLSIKVFILRQRVMSLAVSLVKVEDIFNSTKKEDSDNDVHKENFIKFPLLYIYKWTDWVKSNLKKFILNFFLDKKVTKNQAEKMLQRALLVLFIF